jgi:phospholipid/cholesterol/gamma-HCH transport system permease protein
LAVPYVALLFALVGLLLVLQSERLLAPIGLSSQIPEAATRGIVQGVGPLLLVLIMAGRTGSAMAADLGGQRLSRQVEMWTLLGRDPRHVLFAPRAWALIAAFPLLLLLAEYIALGAGWLFYAVAPTPGLTSTQYWEGVKAAWELGPTVGGLARSAVDGLLLAMIAFLFGTTPKRGAEDVAEGSTRTVVAASIAFLVVEVLWTAIATRIE